MKKKTTAGKQPSRALKVKNKLFTLNRTPQGNKNKKSKKSEHADFFIGYKSVPDASRRFFMMAVPLSLAAGTGLGYLLASSQIKPAATTWGSRVVSREGLLLNRPYPHLLVENPQAADGYDAVFLVSRGKHGGQKFTRGKSGRLVRAHGRLISRHDTNSNYLLETRDIEILDEALEEGETPIGSSVDMGVRKLRGHIVDSKCYFGVMKPSAGLTHKACAALCLRGGIPPFFVPFGRPPDRVVVVTNEHGQAVPELLLPHILDPIEVLGKLLMVNNHYELQIAEADIKSLVSLNC